MGKKIELDRQKLVQRLEEINYSKREDSDDTVMGQMSFAGSLRKLAKLDPENEYKICHSVAEHLLKDVPEPVSLDE